MKWAYVGSDPDPNDKDQMAEERSVTRNIFLQWTFRLWLDAPSTGRP